MVVRRKCQSTEWQLQYCATRLV